MFYKNNAKRLISINTPATNNTDEKGGITNVIKGVAYKLLPAGPAVEIPDEIAEESAFLQHLIDTHEVVEVVDAGAVSDLHKMKKSDLVDYANALKIEFSERDNKLEIIAKIEAS